jgi:hypothetical protein
MPAPPALPTTDGAFVATSSATLSVTRVFVSVRSPALSIPPPSAYEHRLPAGGPHGAPGGSAVSTATRFPRIALSLINTVAAAAFPEAGPGIRTPPPPVTVPVVRPPVTVTPLIETVGDVAPVRSPIVTTGPPPRMIVTSAPAPTSWMLLAIVIGPE